jgi:hypothetical protein
MLGTKVFGSNDGTEAIARISPLFGSTTTAAPRPTDRNASSVMAWIRASMVKKTFAPCCGGSSRKIPSMVPFALRRKYRMPGFPRKYSSAVFSMFDFPSTSAW